MCEVCDYKHKICTHLVLCPCTYNGMHMLVKGDTKKQKLLKNPTKIEEIQEKKFIDRN